MTRESSTVRNPVGARWLSAVGAAWVLSLGFDLFLHAGLLARLYARPSSFLLPPEAAFRRIPLGYLAFLILTVALWWLMRRLDISGAGRVGGLGLTAGAVVWGALLLGMASITTARPVLLLAWWIGQSVELGLAGMVLGAMASGTRRRRVWTRVVIAVICCVVATVVMQSLGLAPAMRLTPK